MRVVSLFRFIQVRFSPSLAPCFPFRDPWPLLLPLTFWICSALGAAARSIHTLFLGDSSLLDQCPLCRTLWMASLISDDFEGSKLILLGEHFSSSAAILRWTVAIARPRFPGAYNNRADHLRKAGRLSPPSRILTALALYPEFAQAYNKPGLIYFYLLEDRLAPEDFNKAIELRPRAASSMSTVPGSWGDRAIPPGRWGFYPRLQLDPGQRRDRKGARRNLPRARRRCRSECPRRRFLSFAQIPVVL